MKSVRNTIAVTAVALTVTPSTSFAQHREPLCVTTELRRLVSVSLAHETHSTELGHTVAVALREPHGETAFVLAARGLDATPGLTVVRVNRRMETVGERLFVADPVAQTEQSSAMIHGVAVDGGVLIVQRIAGGLYTVMVPPEGGSPSSVRVATNIGEGEHFAWITVTSATVNDSHGAIALAGTSDGRVLPLRFDGHGTPVGQPRWWTQRVGGTMRLLPIAQNTVPTVILERPVRGTTATGGQAREQVLLRLSDTLDPVGTPSRLGLGPDPIAMATQGLHTIVTQWAESRAIAVVTLTPSGNTQNTQDTQNTLRADTPRLWSTRPLEGSPVGHTLGEGPHGELYDLAFNTDDNGSATHAYLTYIPPSGTPFSRRDVIPTRGRVIATPALITADDGVTVVLVSTDELGTGLDAIHLRCELVQLPQR